MTVTMDQVLDHLGREEPDYAQAAQLGPEALPHLTSLVQGADPGLAAKAASLAGRIDASQSPTVLELAARHPEPVVRVAAAAAARSLTRIPTTLAMALLNDVDIGVRKWGLKALEAHQPEERIKARVQEISQSDPDIGLRNRARQIISQLP